MPPIGTLLLVAVIVTCTNSVELQVQENPVLLAMINDLKGLIEKVEYALQDAFSVMNNEGHMKPVWLQVEMLQEEINNFNWNNTDGISYQELDSEILSFKLDLENGILIVTNLLLFDQVRFDPKIISAFHQLLFAMRALQYHTNTMAQYLYNFWQSQAAARQPPNRLVFQP